MDAIASARVQAGRVMRTWATLESSAAGADPQDPVGRRRDCPHSTGEPEHIAATTAFLASDAARMITGATILADGGRSAY